MYCVNCGKQIDGDSRFCAYCGSPVQDPEPPSGGQNAPESAGNGRMWTEPRQKKPRKKLSRSQIAVIAVVSSVLIIALAVTLYFVLRPPRIKLNDYVSVDFTGYDGYGKAVYSFDITGFTSEYGDVLAKASGDMSSPNLSLCSRMLSTTVSYSLSQDTGLSNGDSVTLTWDCDSDRAGIEYGVKLVFEDMSFTAEGLEPVREIDPFQYLDVIYRGTMPFASVDYIDVLDYGAVFEYVDFQCEPDSGLSNGDTVTLRLSFSDDTAAETIAETNGVTFSRMEAEYTVSGLDSYDFSISDIPSDLLNSLIETGRSALTEQSENGFNLNLAVTSVSHIESVFLVADDDPGWGANNMLFLLYQVDVVDEGITGNGSWQPYTSYNYVVFEDLLLSSGGSVEASQDEYEYSNTSIYNGEFHVYGYESRDDLYGRCIEPRLDRYHVA